MSLNFAVQMDVQESVHRLRLPNPFCHSIDGSPRTTFQAVVPKRAAHVSQTSYGHV